MVQWKTSFVISEYSSEFDGEHGCGRNNRNRICNWFGKEDGKYFVLEEQWQNEDQRYEKDDFSQYCQEQRDFGIAKGNECLLAGNLDTEDQRYSHIDADCPYRIVT